MVRGRGSEIQSHRGAVHYLHSLELELARVSNLLFEAWSDLDQPKSARKFLKHCDAAQQRLHRAIKKIASR